MDVFLFFFPLSLSPKFLSTRQALLHVDVYIRFNPPSLSHSVSPFPPPLRLPPRRKVIIRLDDVFPPSSQPFLSFLSCFHNSALTYSLACERVVFFFFFGCLLVCLSSSCGISHHSDHTPLSYSFLRVFVTAVFIAVAPLAV
jgi:hypothetical protein